MRGVPVNNFYLVVAPFVPRKTYRRIMIRLCSVFQGFSWIFFYKEVSQRNLSAHWETQTTGSNIRPPSSYRRKNVIGEDKRFTIAVSHSSVQHNGLDKVCGSVNSYQAWRVNNTEMQRNQIVLKNDQIIVSRKFEYYWLVMHVNGEGAWKTDWQNRDADDDDDFLEKVDENNPRLIGEKKNQKSIIY